MDEITFRSDTVLSDVHLYTPNQRRLMVRLNGMGQPVFLSQFKLLWDRDSQTDSVAEGSDHTEGTPPAGTVCSQVGASLQGGADTTTPEGLAAQLDEDGDLDVVRRPRAASASEPPGPPRDKVHPMILTQEEDDILEDEAPESSPYNVIKIEHTMATPLEDVGKQVWRGALLLADYILFQRDLFQGRTVLELGAGTGLASIIAATVAQTVYCTASGSYESVLHIRWPEYWSFSFSITPSNEHPGLLSFRMDWLDVLAVQGTLKSLLQHHRLKDSSLFFPDHRHLACSLGQFVEQQVNFLIISHSPDSVDSV